MDEKNPFSEFLRNYRTERGLSTNDIHEKTGVSQPYLSQIENGKKPSIKIINKISEGLKLNRYYLMRLAGYITEEDEENLYGELEYKEKKLKALSSQYSTTYKYLNDLKSALDKSLSKIDSDSETKEILRLIEITEKESMYLKNESEAIKLQIIDIAAQLDSSLNGIEEKQLNELISNVLDHSASSIDLLEILSSDVEVSLGKKKFTDLEKKKILSILKTIFD